MADASRHSMYYVPETLYGVTPDTPAFKVLRSISTTLGLSKNSFQSDEQRSDRQIADFRHGAYQVGGDIGIEFSAKSFDDLLEAVLCGTWSADTPALGTDELKAGTERRSFSILRHFADMQTADKPWHLFTGVELNTFSLSVTPDAKVTGSFGVVGKGMSTATGSPAGATFAAATDTAILDSFTGALKENDALIAVITEISLNLENGLDPRFVVGSKETIRPSIGRSNCSGQITAYFENSLLLDKFINETASSIEFELPDGAGNKYTFILPKIKYNGGQPDVSGDGPITLTMPFQAVLDPATGTNLIVRKETV